MCLLYSKIDGDLVIVMNCEEYILCNVPSNKIRVVPVKTVLYIFKKNIRRLYENRKGWNGAVVYLMNHPEQSMKVHKEHSIWGQPRLLHQISTPTVTREKTSLHWYFMINFTNKSWSLAASQQTKWSISKKKINTIPHDLSMCRCCFDSFASSSKLTINKYIYNKLKKKQYQFFPHLHNSTLQFTPYEYI